MVPAISDVGCPSVCLLWHQCPAGSVGALTFLVIFL